MCRHAHAQRWLLSSGGERREQSGSSQLDEVGESHPPSYPIKTSRLICLSLLPLPFASGLLHAVGLGVSSRRVAPTVPLIFNLHPLGDGLSGFLPLSPSVLRHSSRVPWRDRRADVDGTATAPAGCQEVVLLLAPDDWREGVWTARERGLRNAQGDPDRQGRRPGLVCGGRRTVSAPCRAPPLTLPGPPRDLGPGLAVLGCQRTKNRPLGRDSYPQSGTAAPSTPLPPLTCADSRLSPISPTASGVLWRSPRRPST